MEIFLYVLGCLPERMWVACSPFKFDQIKNEIGTTFFHSYYSDRTLRTMIWIFLDKVSEFRSSPCLFVSLKNPSWKSEITSLWAAMILSVISPKNTFKHSATQTKVRVPFDQSNILLELPSIQLIRLMFQTLDGHPMTSDKSKYPFCLTAQVGKNIDFNLTIVWNWMCSFRSLGKNCQSSSKIHKNSGSDFSSFIKWSVLL